MIDYYIILFLSIITISFGFYAIMYDDKMNIKYIKDSMFIKFIFLYLLVINSFRGILVLFKVI